MEPTMNDLMNEIKKIRVDVNIIKKNTIDSDSILTSKEEKIHEQGLLEYERGETVSLDEIEIERKNAGLEI